MNPADAAEVAYRQESCRQTFAAVAGSAGVLQTARDHLVARFDAAVRRFGTNASDETLRRKMDAADAALERYDELVEAGTCPGCKYSLNTEGHGPEPCEGPAICNQCDRPVEDEQDRPLCLRCEGTVRAHARLEQARIDEERGT